MTLDAPLDSEKSLHDPTKQKAALETVVRDVLYNDPKGGGKREEGEFHYNGARCGARTHDPEIKSLVLFQHTTQKITRTKNQSTPFDSVKKKEHTRI